MRTFWQTLYRTFSRQLTWLLAIEVFILGLLNLICIWYQGNSQPLVQYNTAILCTMLAMYGFVRVWRFHPAFNKEYLTQLTISPWHFEKQLPRGPIHLFWADAAILGLFLLLTFLLPVQSLWMFPVMILGSYNLCLFISFLITGQIGFATVYILLAPLLVYPHFDNMIILISVLLIMTFVGLYAVRVYLKEFPWNTNWWKSNQLEELRNKVIQERIAQWPFQDLCDRNIFSIGYFFGFFITVVFWWYMHVISWYAYKLDAEDYGVIFFLIPLYMTILRLMRYALKYHPPISFFGRFSTGRLIIPGYDIIFVGPVLVLLSGIIMPLLLKKIGVANHIAYELSTSVAVFLCLSFPPNFEKWHYTGKHRIAKIPIKPMRTMRTNQVNGVFRSLMK